MADLSGRHFGPYQIIEPLGEGGMAVVYKAYQPSMERYVALKVLPTELAAEPEFVGRFRQEARLLASLQHPHILPIFDFGEREGVTFIVMPYVKTGTLGDRLRGVPLDIARATRITTQVGEALDYAHSQGLVHRDIKPSNILIDERGNCLLTDFGIAKLYQATSGFTNTGGIIGTPSYMSPEQGQGTPVDQRTDIYSLGVLFFEMVTGRVPFAADTPIAVVLQHITDPLPSPRRLNPSIPELVERVILKATAKDPQFRFESAGAMVRALQSGDPQTVIVPQPAPPQPDTLLAPPQVAPGATNRRWLLLGGVALLALILSVGAGLLWALQARESLAEATVQPELTPIVGGGESAEISPADDAGSTEAPSTPMLATQESDDAVPFLLQEEGEATAAPGTSTAGATATANPTFTATPAPPTATAAQLGPETIVLGQSAGGVPIEAVRFGNGPNAVFFVGGIHAGFAPASVRMAQNAVQHFTETPQDVPDSATVYVVVSMNPDSTLDPGFLPGRLNDNGVDLNRNWNCFWTQDPPIENQTVPGAGGPEPFSEPETRALSDFLLDKEARAVVFWEARAVPGLVLPGACGPDSEVSNPLALAYAQPSGYRWQVVESFSGVVVRGDASNWLDLQGIPSIFVLMPSFTEPDWDTNLRGVLAVVREYGR